MPKNEEGEFELILGNRQLLSVFFIVVILLGVFFTMGYIVGRNSSPLVADNGQKPPEAAPHTSVVVPPADTPVSKPTESAPATAAPVEQAPAAPAEPKKETPVVEHKAKADEPKPASPVADQPAAGATYLQLTATQRAEAELFVDVLAKKGFHALYAAVPDKSDVFRVLVGPLKDSSSIAQARSDLEKAGFQGVKAIVRKY